MTTQRSFINGLVLTGGYSTRMGTDKSLLVYNGKPQREYLFELLQGCCDAVYTSCRHGQQVPDALNPLEDAFTIPGPMNGILTALANDRETDWLIVAVDMPHINASALQNLISEREGDKLATCFLNPETGDPEPLLTLWERGAYHCLLDFVADGRNSPRDFLKTHPVKMIAPPNSRILININYPQ